MNTLDIVLINVICYLGGVLSGVGGYSLSITRIILFCMNKRII